MGFNTKTVVENDGQHIHHIIATTPCKRHKKPLDEPCFEIFYTGSKGSGVGICNARVVRAGYNGQISPSSLSQKVSRPNARPRPRR